MNGHNFCHSQFKCLFAKFPLLKTKLGMHMETP